MECGSKPDPSRSLCSCREHRQRVRRNRELLKEMVINHRVHVETYVIGVFDLPHDLPDHVVVRLTGRSLDFAVDSETHRIFHSVSSASTYSFSSLPSQLQCQLDLPRVKNGSRSSIRRV